MPAWLYSRAEFFRDLTRIEARPGPTPAFVAETDVLPLGTLTRSN